VGWRKEESRPSNESINGTTTIDLWSVKAPVSSKDKCQIWSNTTAAIFYETTER